MTILPPVNSSGGNISDPVPVPEPGPAPVSRNLR